MCPPQKYFFYCRHFSKVMDQVFIALLVRTIEENHFLHVDPNITAIHNAIAKVNQCFNTRLCYRYGLCHWNHLKERHATFTWLINHPGVRWIPRPKLLLVDEHLWEEIGRENHFARAYRWEIEPAWTELKIIFGDPLNGPTYDSNEELYAELAQSPDETIVLISSDSDDFCSA